MIDAPLTSVAVVTSVKGAVRGNHYHKTDYHYCWLQRGAMVYLYRRVGETGRPRQWTITPGQLFYTPPMHEHARAYFGTGLALEVMRLLSACETLLKKVVGVAGG